MPDQQMFPALLSLPDRPVGADAVAPEPEKDLGDLVTRSESGPAYITVRDVIGTANGVDATPTVASRIPLPAGYVAAVSRKPAGKTRLQPSSARLTHILFQALMSSVAITAAITVALHIAHH